MRVKIFIDCDGDAFKPDVPFEVCRILEGIVFRVRHDGPDWPSKGIGVLEDVQGRYAGYIDVEK